MNRGTAGVPQGVLLESNGISRDLTPSGLKTPAAPALKGRRSHEICQDLTDRRRDHNPRVGGSSPSSATSIPSLSGVAIIALIVAVTPAAADASVAWRPCAKAGTWR